MAEMTNSGTALSTHPPPQHNSLRLQVNLRYIVLHYIVREASSSLSTSHIRTYYPGPTWIQYFELTTPSKNVGSNAAHEYSARPNQIGAAPWDIISLLLLLLLMN